ncbi:MAG: GDP-L-fucose synthase family protein [Planctomycetota bacterium]
MTITPATTRIFVAGHRGLVGGAVCRLLTARGFNQVITRTRDELDLRDATAVGRFFGEARPEVVILAAAKVGGILANSTQPADFIADNIAIASAVIPQAHAHGVRKLLNLGSSCIYPRLAPQPIREESLLTGPLEETNRAYAIAKIAAIELCDSFRKQHGADFISAMPTNLYGPGDNFHPQHSHVLPALMRRFHEAARDGRASVELWGTGAPLREFLHVDDLADACLFLLDRFSAAGPINVGTGRDLSIRELATMIAQVVGYHGALEWDASKPDGTPRKLLDVSRLTALGWTAPTGLRDGIASTYAWFCEHVADARGM